MSPNLGSCWATWGTVSSDFRASELRGDRLESVGHVAPLLPSDARRDLESPPSCAIATSVAAA